LSTARNEPKNQGWEGAFLGNLGNAYASLGDLQKAIEFQEQQLANGRTIGDRRREGIALGNLGDRYSALGNEDKAIEYYKQELIIVQEIGNRRDESTNLTTTGDVFLNLGKVQKAKENFRNAIQIADEISFPETQISARCGLAETCLYQNDLINARAAIEAALQYDVPDNNHNASALHGIIALRQGDEVAARGAFVRAIGQADEILSKTAEYYSALDAKGLSICGLAICDLRLKKDLTGFTESPTGGETRSENLSGLVQDAIETFQKARKIAPHAGVVKSVLRLFDELAKCDTDGLLKGVREVIASS
jgi:tetratricopeptide (TPR) repeat protein